MTTSQTMHNHKSILITGASTGIGKTCALHFDKMGFKVFAGVRKENDGLVLSNEGSDKLQPIILDVVKEETIMDAVNTISAETAYPLFGLVNNAGVGISGVLEATPTSEFRQVLEVNVLGLHAVTKAFLPLLRQNKGRVINVGSIASFMTGPNASSYAASKFAVRALTSSLRIELQPFGMSVSLVAPGAIESAIWDKSKAYKEKLRGEMSAELYDAYEPFFVAGEKTIKTIRPIPAIEVAKAVEHGLTASRPKPVYLVGNDAKQAYKFSRMPSRLTDWLILKRLG